MARIVLFGNGITARLAHFYLSHDSAHEVVAFTVDAGHVKEAEYCGLPLVAFDEVVKRYPPATHKMLVALGYGQMNGFRAKRYEDAKALGYELISHVSSRATVWPDVEIGDNCLIMDDVTIQPFAHLGNDVIVWSAGHVGQGSRIADHTFIASHAVVGGDVNVDERCFLGINSTIADGVHVAHENVIGAGALIEADTGAREVFSPAQTRKLPVTSDRLSAV